jgi:hypothetical protein
MSYSACANSALLAPDAYPVGAIGSTFTPVINTNAVASAALLQPVAAFTLPKGKWLISGVLTLDTTVGGETLVGNTAIAKDAVVFWRSQNVTVEDSVSISLSAVIDSDGTAVITVPCNYTSSGSSTYGAIAAPLSVVQATRIA